MNAIQKLTLYGLALPVAAAALCLSATTVQAQVVDVPDYDQLRQEATDRANAEVQARLSSTTSSTSSSSQPTSTTASSNQSTATEPAPGVIVLNTGDDVTIDTSVERTSNTEVTNNNTAVVNQTATCQANTGGNTANRNISIGGNAGSIQTGDAACNTALSTDVNNNRTQVADTCPDVVNNVTVYNTGDNVNHNSGTNSTCNTTVTNNNNAVINQVVNSDVNTGGNTANRNIAIGGGTAGEILTGNATAGSVVVARGNQNVVIVGGENNNGAPGTGANIYILNTGDGAYVVDRRRYATHTSVSNNNELISNQIVNANANTGGNTANRNINEHGDAGVIRTGDAVVNTALAVNANRNETVISGSGGNATSNVKIVNTGDNLDSDTQTSVENTTTVNNNNTAVINQVVHATANTGNNEANRNIAIGGDAGVIRTGDAVVNTSLTAQANQNATAISGALGQASSNVDVLNTGDDVDIDASNTTSNTVQVNNTNVAVVNQSVVVDANTGNNEANRNIGGSSITTGDVTINTLAVANVNGNLTLIVNADAPIGGAFWNLFTDMFSQDLHGATVTIQGSMAQSQAASAVTNTGNNVVVDLSQADINNIYVNNQNTAVINQHVQTVANTGNNQCNRNVGDCRIVTGDIEVTNVLVANANGNVTLIGNITFPEKPEKPVKPTQPEQPAAPGQPQAQAPAVLAAVHAPAAGAALPATGATNLALVGLLLIGAGALLRRKAVAA